MKIYTKTGDKGETSLIGGQRVPKDHLRIECYGLMDECLSYVALIRDHKLCPTQENNVLLEIQDRMMTIASILATSNEKFLDQIPAIKIDDVDKLEHEIDRMNETLPRLTSFVLPGGNEISSLTHVVRNICRKTERKVIGLTRQEKVPEEVLQYLNRLSDYFFTLARWFLLIHNDDEIVWKPKL